MVITKTIGIRIDNLSEHLFPGYGYFNDKLRCTCATWCLASEFKFSWSSPKATAHTLHNTRSAEAYRTADACSARDDPARSSGDIRVHSTWPDRRVKGDNTTITSSSFLFFLYAQMHGALTIYGSRIFRRRRSMNTYFSFKEKNEHVLSVCIIDRKSYKWVCVERLRIYDLELKLEII